MINQERRDYSNRIGKETEKMFEEACSVIGYKCRKTDDNTDIYQHIDFWITKDTGVETSVDVKGGNHPDCIWVEFKNVRGDNGWLYGSAKYIAFDMPEEQGFVVVSRSELLNYCEKSVEKVFVEKKEATRKLYTRAKYGRKDVISRLELEDLKKLTTYKLVRYK